jgi:tetratricopeptide (TPR) repeat protein
MADWQDDPTEADALFDRGMRHMEAGRLHPAGDCFKRVVELVPAHAEARFQWAVYLHEVGEEDAAVREAREALKLDPDNLSAALLLGECYYQLDKLAMATTVAKDSISRHPFAAPAHTFLGRCLSVTDQEEANECFRRAVELDATYADAWLGLAKGRFDQNDYEGSLEFLEKAHEADPDASGPLLYRGVAEATLGRREQAEKSLLQSIELDPEAPMAYFNLGKLFVVTDRPAQAIVAFEKALEVAPDYLHAGNALVPLYLDKAQEEEETSDKLRWIDKLLAISAELLLVHPKDASLLQFTAIAHHMRDDLAQAEQFFRKAISSEPHRADARANFAGLLLALKQPEEAEVMARSAAAIEEESARVFGVWAEALQTLDRKGEAMDVLMKGVRTAEEPMPLAFELIQLADPVEHREPVLVTLQKLAARFPEDPRAHMLLGDWYHLLGEPTEARDCILHAVELGYDNPIIYRRLGQCEAKLKHYEKAQEYFVKAYNDDPEDSELGYMLATLLFRNDRFQESREILRGLCAAEPDDIRFWSGLHMTASALDDPEDGMRALLEMARLAPEDGSLLLALQHDWHRLATMETNPLWRSYLIQLYQGLNYIPEGWAKPKIQEATTRSLSAPVDSTGHLVAKLFTAQNSSNGLKALHLHQKIIKLDPELGAPLLNRIQAVAILYLTVPLVFLFVLLVVIQSMTSP